MGARTQEVQSQLGPRPRAISEVGESQFSRYRKAMHRFTLLTLAAFATPALLAADVVTLYDPSQPGTFSEQGWFRVSTNLDDADYFFQSEGAITHFDSFPLEYGAGWTTVGLITGNALHPNSQILNSDEGFTFTFDFALDEEVHTGSSDVDGDGEIDESGFSVMMLDKNARGISLNFWENRIWSSGTTFVGDLPPFPQAEYVTQEPEEMATMRRYELTILRGAYRLMVDGKPMLEGLTRSYDHFNQFVDPFDKPNIINIGDGSNSAAARARIGAISIETGFQRKAPLALSLRRSNNALQLSFNSIPGRRYLLQSSDSLTDWEDVTTINAELFTSSHLESISANAPTRYYRVLELAP